MQIYETVSIYRNNREVYFLQDVKSPLVANLFSWPLPIF